MKNDDPGQNQNIDVIFAELKRYIDSIKEKGLNADETDECSGSISFIGMVLDEISSSLKNSGVSERKMDKLAAADLDPELLAILTKLLPYSSNETLIKKFDDLSVYCDKLFMELMSGHSCAIPELKTK